MTSTTAARRKAKAAARRQTPRRWRAPLLWLAALRAVLAIVAIPLAPVLYDDHFVTLVLLRPTKDVLLAAGFLLRRGDINVLELTAATVPVMVLGVWQFFALGRGYAKELRKGDLPGVGGRLLPRKRINDVRKVLDKKGVRLVVLGRLAAFPSALVAAAAGGSDLETRRFLLADAAGALLSIVEIVGAGMLLGEAYEQAGPWLTVGGVVVLLGTLWLFGRYLKRA